MTRTSITRRSLLCGVAALPLAACGGVPDLMIVPEAADIGTAETVFVATNRVFADGAFQAARQETLSFTEFTVEIPPDRETGAVEPARPGRRRGPDLQTEFVASSGNHLGSREGFRAALRAEARRAGVNEAMIFIHGFASTIGTGLYRTAQIRYDFQIPGIAVHYAWPSAGNPLGYAYDRDSSLFARDGLEQLITDIQAAGLNVVLTAHSLGSSVVMEVLRQLRIGGRTGTLDRINGVILFSPDVDVDVFRSQAERIGELPQPFVIFTSQRDQALRLSARITGQAERVGNLAIPDALGEFEITIIDVSAFSGGVRDTFNHFAGASSPAVVQILNDAAGVNNSFERSTTQRPGILPGTILTIQNATQIMLSPITAN
ncbi:alpha/beta hydrolase [Gymnodinialimonas hymeniacidonis]|uniref:alpha/beta hydrolase n=1 Tax=Gymnodinialimonas hymeniacidonis TaxID=3126508 RepID=UPI0034C5C89B